jgi:hypothetical protein
MLPSSNDRPTCFSERFGVPTIALSIALNLEGPVVGVRARSSAMSRAAMPEASINEDCESLAHKNHVGTDCCSCHSQLDVEAIAQSGPMQRPSDCEFRSGISLPVSSHDRAGMRTRRIRIARALATP